MGDDADDPGAELSLCNDHAAYQAKCYYTELWLLRDHCSQNAVINSQLACHYIMNIFLLTALLKSSCCHVIWYEMS